ncbi:taurine transport system permease protein [Azospirillum agricola]|uniref:ABC transporter permease n=1 Tax=Azospirillum agricola TaxID=1720247 RepID=UPI001AE2A415|nr:ABC transporter permease subunit [Azospirillum agricola]MBP2231945.1 taurine transport system permease protein [Azospirillum agricola]
MSEGLAGAAGDRDGAAATRAGAVRSRPLVSVAAVLAVVALWQAAGSLGWIGPALLPTPAEVLQTGRELAETGYRQVPLWEHILVSVARAGVAFLAAVLTGVPLGLVMGVSPTVAALFDPFVQFLRPLPKLALIPLVIVWFGIGEFSKFFLIYIATVLSIVVGAAGAVAAVGQERRRAAAVLGVSRYQMFRHVLLPSTLPELFTSVRLALGIGWTTLIAAEMVAATSGLGWMVVNAGAYLRTDVVMLGIVLLGLIGYGLDRAIVGLQKVMVPWTGHA